MWKKSWNQQEQNLQHGVGWIEDVQQSGLWLLHGSGKKRLLIKEQTVLWLSHGSGVETKTRLWVPPKGFMKSQTGSRLCDMTSWIRAQDKLLSVHTHPLLEKCQRSFCCGTTPTKPLLLLKNEPDNEVGHQSTFSLFCSQTWVWIHAVVNPGL